MQEVAFSRCSRGVRSEKEKAGLSYRPFPAEPSNRGPEAWKVDRTGNRFASAEVKKHVSHVMSFSTRRKAENKGSWRKSEVNKTSCYSMMAPSREL